MVEQSWFGGSMMSAQPLLSFCFILPDASTFGFPSISKQNKEGSIKRKGWPLCIQRARLLQKCLMDFVVHLIFWNHVIWPATRGLGYIDLGLGTLPPCLVLGERGGVGRLGTCSTDCAECAAVPCCAGFLRQPCFWIDHFHCPESLPVHFFPSIPYPWYVSTGRLSSVLFSTQCHCFFPMWACQPLSSCCPLLAFVCPCWGASYLALGL